MLPRLTRQTPPTNFHILVDKVHKEVGRIYELIVLVSSSVSRNWKVVFVAGGVNNAPAMRQLFVEAEQWRDVVIEDLPESWSLNMGKKVIGVEELEGCFCYRWRQQRTCYETIVRGS